MRPTRTGDRWTIITAGLPWVYVSNFGCAPTTGIYDAVSCCQDTA
jgi:hypothetical protein